MQLSQAKDSSPRHDGQMAQAASQRRSDPTRQTDNEQATRNTKFTA